MTLIDVAIVVAAEDRNDPILGQYFVYDRVTKQLYYRTSSVKEKVRKQLYMKADLADDKLTLTPFLRSDLTDFYSVYINNRRLFFHDSKRGYIYVLNSDLP
ncbi:hypothetical protein [Fibrella aquatilis]|uniref:Uncharacterized protein n=1 Tax=Fibrella aquatilis TaxID=2817059 RepID=A0A939GBD6_9BACT|nr:hypothetical protein [Fibrella aquatilis]MBO0934693.1 hypothetical protein [Fibrella aquatilis]